MNDQAVGVSPDTATRLLSAMDRLLAGRPQRTDGRLIKDNLWREAQVSRTTMNRATSILAQWDERIAACDSYTPAEARKQDEITVLQAKLAEKTKVCTTLQQRLDAAATAIAALHHDNTLLRQELGQRGQLVSINDRRERSWLTPKSISTNVS
ncbi:MAG: hypothetical protein ACRC20_12475 [Segniliparus sp.]|uniref:hypothetical protein n=1 Tax=Segniliparus sp. TaxID=2804064 RepID=UPI003F3B544E